MLQPYFTWNRRARQAHARMFHFQTSKGTRESCPSTCGASNQYGIMTEPGNWAKIIYEALASHAERRESNTLYSKRVSYLVTFPFRACIDTVTSKLTKP